METPERSRRGPSPPTRSSIARIYALYDDGLKRANAVDFDDILLRPSSCSTRTKTPDVGERYAQRCLHLLVDEYQDTNRPQYLLIKALTSAHHNVCVVGDEDQSIYKFRGAEIRNILDFERDHPGAAVVKLEQNYRSTGDDSGRRRRGHREQRRAQGKVALDPERARRPDRPLPRRGRSRRGHVGRARA